MMMNNETIVLSSNFLENQDTQVRFPTFHIHRRKTRVVVEQQCYVT